MGISVNDRDLEAKADDDFAQALGTLIRPEWIYGTNSKCETEDIHALGRVLCRVIATSTDDIHHWCDEWLDPYWNLEVIEDPEGLCADVPWPWTFGPCYAAEVDPIRV